MEPVLTILTVDDEQIVLDSVAKHLKKENYTLRSALSVKEALEILNEHPVDIILTDLMMPETDGLEFLTIMQERNPAIPVVMITGYATINTALKATKLGAFDYLAKPFTRAELTSVVSRAAELARASRQHSDSRPTPPPPAEPAEVPVDHTKYGWQRLEDDGTVVLGIGRPFLEAVGKIQNVFLPSKGDELRQGGVYVRIFSADLRSHTILSPLSGVVVEVNDKCLTDLSNLLDKKDCEWLIRLKPSKFEFEARDLEL